MSRTLATLLVLGLSIGLPLAGESARDAPPGGGVLLLGEDYPIEVSVSFHKALLHWLDSLTMLALAGGVTGGKTVPAHQAEYARLFGSPTEPDRAMFGRFRRVRRTWARSAEAGDRDLLTLAFFTADDMDEALARAGRLLDPGDASDLGEAIRHFEPKYRKIWRNGSIPHGFVVRTAASPRRAELAAFLVTLARFYDVAPRQKPRPHLVLAPVPSGYGTHAQAIGRFLLIEIRPREGLADEAAPIVHENAHLVFSRIPASRMEALERAARGAGPHGAAAWSALKEALPTAIAQGVADRRFRREIWSMRQDWYHTTLVDGYAKRIFPLIQEALREGTRFDEPFVGRLVEAYRQGTVRDDGRPTERESPPTRRSP